MSEANLEVVRQHIAAYESGNYDAALAAYHPDVVCDATVRPEGRVYRGREGIAEAIRVSVGTWNDWRWEVEKLIDADDRVLMVVRESAKGQGKRSRGCPTDVLALHAAWRADRPREALV